jgi:hypothetical protein
MALIFVAASAIPTLAATCHVPDQFSTIQSGIDAASVGDTVLVACGIYYEHDIAMKSGVVLLSETGDADCVTVNARRTPGREGRVLYCENLNESTLIKGFTFLDGFLFYTGSNRGAGVYCGDYSSPTFESCTIRGNHANIGGGMYCTNNSSPTLISVTFESNGGSGPPACAGGGLYCVDSSSPRLADCAFVENGAVWGGAMFCDSGSSPILERVIFDRNSSGNYTSDGGVMYCSGGAPTLTDVVFSQNESFHMNGPFPALRLYSCTGATLTRVTSVGNVGGSLYVMGCSPTVTNCTFYGDDSPYGSLLCAGSPLLKQTIIASTTGGPAIYCDGGQPVLECCDIFGNEGGDWDGCIADQYGINGNISKDPLFCDPANGDLTLNVNSPCAPFSPPNEGCDLIGAWPVACGTTSTDGQEVSPTAVYLAPSVPNPCSSSSRITYMIPAGTDASPVLLRIYDPAGRVVKTLVEAPRFPGVHTATWDGTNQGGAPAANGTYFYRLKVNGQVQTRRLTLMK